MEPVFDPRRDFDSGWAEADPSGRHVRVGNWYVWTPIHVTMPGARRQPALRMTIDSSTGAPRCVALHFDARPDGGEIVAGDVRAVDLENWVASIIAMCADEIVYSGPSVDGVEPYVVNTLVRVPDTKSPDFRAALETMRTARLRERRRGGSDLLRQVAATYLQNPDKPAVAVQKGHSMSARTAFRYISDARKQGLIPEREGKRGAGSDG